jgi:hypothetical protein
VSEQYLNRSEIDGEVEQNTVTQPSFPFKPGPYRLYLLRLQRAFRSHHMAGVPGPTLPRRWVELRLSHCSLHLAGLADGDVLPRKLPGTLGTFLSLIETIGNRRWVVFCQSALVPGCVDCVEKRLRLSASSSRFGRKVAEASVGRWTVVDCEPSRSQ